jgi:hypothetical protein
MELVLKKNSSFDLILYTDKKKIFVYDTSRGISRLVKANFDSEYEIDYCYKNEHIDNYNLSGYFGAILIINDFDDFERIKNISKKVSLVLSSSSIKKSFLEYPQLDNVIVFDLNIKRKDMIKLFRSKLVSFEK